MKIEDMTPDHIRRINPKTEYKEMQQLKEPDNPTWFTGPGWACVDKNDEVFALVGLIALDNYGRYRAWTILCENIGVRRLMFVAHGLRQWLDRDGDYRRIEAMSLTDAEDELFWMRDVLRLNVEGRLRSWLPDGSDVYLFSRVKGRD